MCSKTKYLLLRRKTWWLCGLVWLLLNCFCECSREIYKFSVALFVTNRAIERCLLFKYPVSEFIALYHWLGLKLPNSGLFLVVSWLYLSALPVDTFLPSDSSYQIGIMKYYDGSFLNPKLRTYTPCQEYIKRVFQLWICRPAHVRLSPVAMSGKPMLPVLKLDCLNLGRTKALWLQCRTPSISTAIYLSTRRRKTFRWSWKYRGRTDLNVAVRSRRTGMQICK